MNQPMGKAAYDACCQYLASRPGHEGDPGVPAEEWEDLPTVYREAWEAAAQAVLAEHSSQHVGMKAPSERTVQL